MNKKDMKIWIWLQKNEVHKAVYNPTDTTLTVYNERDEIMFKRTGITPELLTQFEAMFLAIGAKRIDGHKEPFTYL